MEKLSFVFIGHDWDGNPKGDKLPSGEIRAIRVKYDDGEFHYVPIIPSRWETVDQVKEVWVRYQGCIKVGKRKQYTIPVFDGSVEHFKEYLDQWGEDVMAYCLNGDLFHRSGDCCNIRYCEEWMVLKYYGAKKFNKFSKLFKQMRDIQRKVIDEKYVPLFKEHGYGAGALKDYIMNPEYNLGFSFLAVPTMGMNILVDEGKTDKLYKRVRYWELYETHPQYPEYLKRRKAADDYRGEHTNDNLYWDREYEDLREKQHELDHIIHTDVDKQIADEVENGCERYPIRVSDKFRIMFGEEFNDLYNKLLKVSMEIEKKPRKKTKKVKEKKDDGQLDLFN